MGITGRLGQRERFFTAEAQGRRAKVVEALPQRHGGHRGVFLFPLRFKV
jgi:hypothetical protein